MSEPITIFELKKLLCDRKYISTKYSESEITFTTPKGWIISLGWSSSHYCSSRLLNSTDPGILRDAEIAIWTVSNPNELIQFEGWDGQVKGWVPVPEILRIIDYLET